MCSNCMGIVKGIVKHLVNLTFTLVPYNRFVRSFQTSSNINALVMTTNMSSTYKRFAVYGRWKNRTFVSVESLTRFGAYPIYIIKFTYPLRNHVVTYKCIVHILLSILTHKLPHVKSSI